MLEISKMELEPLTTDLVDLTYLLEYKFLSQLHSQRLRGGTNNLGQIKHAMASAVSEIKAMDPQSLEEAI